MKRNFKRLMVISLTISLLALSSLPVYAQANYDKAESDNSYSVNSTSDNYPSTVYNQLLNKGWRSITSIPSKPFVDLDVMIYCASTEMYDNVKLISGSASNLPISSSDTVLFGEGSTSYRGQDDSVEVISYQFLLYSDGTIYERTWLQYEGDSITEDDWYPWQESDGESGIGYYRTTALSYFEAHM